MAYNQNLRRSISSVIHTINSTPRVWYDQGRTSSTMFGNGIHLMGIDYNGFSSNSRDHHFDLDTVKTRIDNYVRQSSSQYSFLEQVTTNNNANGNYYIDWKGSGSGYSKPYGLLCFNHEYKNTSTTTKKVFTTGRDKVTSVSDYLDPITRTLAIKLLTMISLTENQEDFNNAMGTIARSYPYLAPLDNDLNVIYKTTKVPVDVLNSDQKDVLLMNFLKDIPDISTNNLMTDVVMQRGYPYNKNRKISYSIINLSPVNNIITYNLVLIPRYNSSGPKVETTGFDLYLISPNNAFSYNWSGDNKRNIRIDTDYDPIPFTTKADTIKYASYYDQLSYSNNIINDRNVYRYGELIIDSSQDKGDTIMRNLIMELLVVVSSPKAGTIKIGVMDHTKKVRWEANINEITRKRGDKIERTFDTNGEFSTTFNDGWGHILLTYKVYLTDNNPVSVIPIGAFSLTLVKLENTRITYDLNLMSNAPGLIPTISQDLIWTLDPSAPWDRSIRPAISYFNKYKDLYWSENDDTDSSKQLSVLSNKVNTVSQTTEALQTKISNMESKMSEAGTALIPSWSRKVVR